MARESIGTRQAESVATRQLVLAFNYLATLREQIAAIEDELQQRVEELQSPLFSPGITANLVAVIHAEGPLQRSGNRRPPLGPRRLAAPDRRS